VNDSRRALPAVGVILEQDGVHELLARYPRTLVGDAVRSVIADARAGARVPANDVEWRAAVESRLEVRTRPSLRAAINATGVILHTNLGRAPLATAALAAIAETARGASTLEYDVARGERGSRHVHCASLLAELTGAEDAMVVNNCAAALVLALQCFAAGRESLVSRGELIEIGGSFRIPDIMATSGTTLVEVGTTNRTHVADYRAAITPRTAAIVKVHRSNFALEGFVAEASIRELASLAAEAKIPLLHDFGSGLMLDLAPWGLSGEPRAADVVGAGASLVMMSGDKLLGGPQAGLIVGRRDLVERLRKHSLARALRVDKMTIAALEATLALYRDPARAVREIPVLAMLTADATTIRARAEAIASGIGAGVTVTGSIATVGGGAFPTARIPSWSLTLPGSATALEQQLREGATPVVARIADDRVHLDLRSVQPADDDALASLVTTAMARA
jgi:L-seryl-tRNA(Ser) seleniumtransferase